MKKAKKATWYTIVSTGIAFTVLACSTAQAEKMVASYQNDQSSMTANAVGKNQVQLIKSFEERKGFQAQLKEMVKASGGVGAQQYVKLKVNKAKNQYTIQLLNAKGGKVIAETKGQIERGSDLVEIEAPCTKLWGAKECANDNPTAV
jgi:hypothetical protein